MCLLASVFWPIYPGYGGRHAFVMAQNLLAAGYEVDVIAAFPIDLRRRGNFFRQRPISTEVVDGIRVIRVFTLLPTNLGLPRKLAFYLSFMFTSLTALPIVRRADYVFGLHPPPFFLIIPGNILAILLRAKYLIRVTDVWPDVFFEFKLTRSPILRQLVVLLTKINYALAHHIMAFTPQIKERMVRNGVRQEKLSVVEMAIDSNLFEPLEVTRAERNDMGLEAAEDKFIVLYAGAFALTYDFDLFLEAAERLRNEDAFFVLLGDGDAKRHIIDTISARRLTNVLMPPPVSRPESVAKYINCSDVCVMPLKPEMVTSTLTRPSKVFEFWACGKPVISCTKGEMQLLTQESGAGMVVAPGDTDGFVEAIRYLQRNPEVAEDMGKRAREFVVDRFSYESLTKNLVSTLEQIG